MSILPNQTYAGVNAPMFRASLNDGQQQAVSIETLSITGTTLNSQRTSYQIGVFNFPETVSNVTVKGLLKYSTSFTNSITANIYLTENADGSPSGAFGTTLTGITLTGTGSYVNLFGLTLSNISTKDVYLAMTVTAGLPIDGVYPNQFFAPSSWSIPASGQWTVGYAPYTTGAVAGGAILGIGT
jgi:hypothetical protein